MDDYIYGHFHFSTSVPRLLLLHCPLFSTNKMTTVLNTHTVLPADVVLSRDRVEPGSVNIPVGEFPGTASVTSVLADDVCTQLFSSINQALAEKDYEAVSSLFHGNCYWRDHLALSWDLHTWKGQEQISKILSAGCCLTKVEIDRSSAFRAPHKGPIDGIGVVQGIESFITFTTDIGTGRGVVRLAEKDNQWKIFTLFTTLCELKGHEESLNDRRPRGVEHGGTPNRENWQDRRTTEINFDKKNPAVLIIGMNSIDYRLSKC